MTAAEAKSDTDKVNHSKYTDEIESIFDKIEEAKNEGDYHIKVNPSYYSRTYFRTLGFKVIQDSSMCSFKWIIQWH